MYARYLTGFLVSLFVFGCAAGVNVDSMFRDFDDYEEDMRAVSTDDQVMEILEIAREKRTDAGILAAEGKKRDAVPLIEQAMADARLALEMDKMNAASRRAETCRLEVEQSRAKWQEALYVLKQTEEFVGKEASISRREPEASMESPGFPESTLMPATFPPPAFDDVQLQWDMWREAAFTHKVAAADLDNIYQNIRAQALDPKVKEDDAAQLTYLAARAAQALECRVRAEQSDRVCADAAQLTAEFGDARADALSATLDLERGLQESLRGELNELRVEAKTRQDELFDALSQMEGKFASIRRDARGTIVSLADILFDFDKATLRRDVEFNLVKIATILNQFGEMGVLIEGHTDSIGSEEYNLGLSKRRAQAVYDFLISQDVKAERLSWEGYGESRPVADNGTDEGRQQNRRVDLVIQEAN